MVHWKHFAVVEVTLLAAACQSPTQPAASLTARGGDGSAISTPHGSATGGGIYRWANTADARFEFNAVAQPNGSAPRISRCASLHPP